MPHKAAFPFDDFAAYQTDLHVRLNGAQNAGLRLRFWILSNGVIHHLILHQTSILPDSRFDFLSDLRIITQELLGIFTALTNTLGIIGEPCTRFFNQACGHP